MIISRSRRRQEGKCSTLYISAYTAKCLIYVVLCRRHALKYNEGGQEFIPYRKKKISFLPNQVSGGKHLMKSHAETDRHTYTRVQTDRQTHIHDNEESIETREGDAERISDRVDRLRLIKSNKSRKRKPIKLAIIIIIICCCCYI